MTLSGAVKRPPPGSFPFRALNEWLYDVTLELRLSDETYVRAAEIMCQAMGKLQKKRSDLQGFASACYVFAAQIEDSWDGPKCAFGSYPVRLRVF